MSKNFLLGRGHALTSEFTPNNQGGGPKRNHPYTFEEARKQIQPKIKEVERLAKKIIRDACPRGQAVIEFTLNPEYLAKSHLPQQLFKSINASLIGSRERSIVTQQNIDRESSTTDECPEYIVATGLAQVRDLSSWLDQIDEGSPLAHDVRKIEDVRLETGSDKTRNPRVNSARYWELVLHANSDNYVVEGLVSYSEKYLKDKVVIDLQDRIYEGGLCFLPVHGSADDIQLLAEYSFVRCIRPMPKLRAEKINFAAHETKEFRLPNADAIDPRSRVLLLDGGRPQTPGFDRWVTDIEIDNIGDPDLGFQEHGLGVLSSLLFGSCKPGEVAPRPIFNVDSVRIFDTLTGSGDKEYFNVLSRIRNVLLERGDKYDFICLCCGPDLAVEDGEPSAWTSVLDKVCARIRPELFCAAGNGGELDRLSGLSRIQPPSDGVNIVSIGACTSGSLDWKKTLYSCNGPGRRPGYIKPDLLAPGGELPHDPYFVAGPADGTLVPKQGTSFATPHAVRIAASISATLGDEISPLGIKALLINRADQGRRNVFDVGWGRISESIESLTGTEDNEAIVVYEGKLIPNQHRVVPIPLTESTLDGSVEITATFCFITETDPHHPLNYTRSALEVKYRPDSERYEVVDGKKRDRPATRTFFDKKKIYQLEKELRTEEWKWESVLHGKKRPSGKNLNEPFFEINYMTREESSTASNPSPIQYALVVRLESKAVPDLYDKISQRYNRILVPMRHALRVPTLINHTLT